MLTFDIHTAAHLERAHARSTTLAARCGGPVPRPLVRVESVQPSRIGCWTCGGEPDGWCSDCGSGGPSRVVSFA